MTGSRWAGQITAKATDYDQFDLHADLGLVEVDIATLGGDLE